MKYQTISAILLATSMTAVAQKDYTSFIKNPSFETDGLKAWNTSGYWIQNNDAVAEQGWKKAGTTYVETYGAEWASDAFISQTVEGLPDGYYQVMVDAHAVLQRDPNADITGVTLFAGRGTEPITKGGTYSVGGFAASGHLKIGLRNHATIANWIAADNFRIVAADATIAVYHAHLDAALTEAMSLKSDGESKKYYLPEALSASIEAAKKAKSSQDKAVLLKAIVGVEDAIYDYQTVRLSHYDRLLSAIFTARNNASRTNYEGKSILQQAISQAETALSKESDIDRIDQAEETLSKATNTYLANRPSEWVTIRNGQMWHTDDGAEVQAHAPGFVRVGDIWYMCGEDRSGWWNPDVNLYSSTDLVNWKFEKKIIANGVTTPELGSSRMIERPKLLYNKKTGKYVVWCHYEAGNYGASEAACFECDSVNGAYKLVWSGRPMNVKSRDCNIFQDEDGTAYFTSTTEENAHLGLFRLTDDYRGPLEHTRLFEWQRREAPAIAKLWGHRYFMFSSACSGWDPNQCKLSTTTDLRWGWSKLANIGNNVAFDTQPAAILEVRGTKATTYLYVGDRWFDPGLPDTKTIVFPVMFDGTSCDFTYRERFDINFVTGEWRETPAENYFVSKESMKRIDTGNPSELLYDLGKMQVVQGFQAVPWLWNGFSGLIRNYQVLTSRDGKTYSLEASGEWLSYGSEVTFKPRTCRYVKFVALDGYYSSFGDFNIVKGTTPIDLTPLQLIDGAESTQTSVQAGGSTTLQIQLLDDGDANSIVWSNGTKGSTLTLDNIQSDQTITAKYDDHTFTFNVKVATVSQPYASIFSNENGYKLVSSPQQISQLADDHYFVLASNEANLLIGMAEGKHNGNRALFYQTAVNPTTDLSKVFTIETFGDAFSLRNVDYDGLLLQTEGDKAFNLRTNDQAYGCQWTRLLMIYKDGAWTVENGKYPGNWLGLWTPENGYVDGEEIALNKTGDDIAHMQLFAISKDRFNQDYITGRSTPCDVTPLLQNPSFLNANGFGWTLAGTWGNQRYNGAAEVWHSANFDISQTITGLPDGQYTLTCQMVNGEGSNTSYLYATSGSDTKKAVVSQSCEGSDFETQRDKMAEDAEYGKLSVTLNVTNGTLSLGVKEPSEGNTWLVFDNFTLTYNGSDVNGITTIENDKSANDKIYDISGRLIQGKPQKGIYIMNGKKIVF